MEDYNRKRVVYLLAFLVMLILNAYYCHASAVQVKGNTALPCNDGLGECLIIEDEWNPYERRKLYTFKVQSQNGHKPAVTPCPKKAYGHCSMQEHFHPVLQNRMKILHKDFHTKKKKNNRRSLTSDHAFLQQILSTTIVSCTVQFMHSFFFFSFIYSFFETCIILFLFFLCHSQTRTTHVECKKYYFNMVYYNVNNEI